MKLQDFEYHITEYGIELIRYCGTATIVHVPEKIDGFPVTKIGAFAFSPYISEFSSPQEAELEQIVVQWQKEVEHRIQWCQDVGENKIQHIYLPDTIEEIGKGAFFQCVNLQEVRLGDKIKEIGEQAWMNCKSLWCVRLPNKITVVKKETFRNCTSLTKVIFPSTIEMVDDYAFCNCRGLVKIELPDQVHIIGNHAFYDCRKLQLVSFSGQTETFGDGVFKNCDALERIQINIRADEPTRLHVLFSNLENELTLGLNYCTADGRVEHAELFLPGYECEYIGDLLARHFKEVVHGAGRGYIFCVSQPQVNFEAYDELFLEAQRLDDPIHLIQIALCRLKYPFRLQEKSRLRYEDYLREHGKEVGEFLMNREDMNSLEFLAEKKLFSEDSIQRLEEIACFRKRPEYVSFFMDYGNQQKAAKKKTFDFDDL